MPQQTKRISCSSIISGCSLQIRQPIFEISPAAVAKTPVPPPPRRAWRRGSTAVRWPHRPQLVAPESPSLFSGSAQPLGRRIVPADFRGKGAEELVDLGSEARLIRLYTSAARSRQLHERSQQDRGNTPQRSCRCRARGPTSCPVNRRRLPDSESPPQSKTTAHHHGLAAIEAALNDQLHTLHEKYAYQQGYIAAPTGLGIASGGLSPWAIRPAPQRWPRHIPHAARGTPCEFGERYAGRVGRVGGAPSSPDNRLPVPSALRAPWTKRNQLPRAAARRPVECNAVAMVSIAPTKVTTTNAGSSAPNSALNVRSNPGHAPSGKPIQGASITG